MFGTSVAQVFTLFFLFVFFFGYNGAAFIEINVSIISIY